MNNTKKTVTQHMLSIAISAALIFVVGYFFFTSNDVLKSALFATLAIPLHFIDFRGTKDVQKLADDAARARRAKEQGK